MLAKTLVSLLLPALVAAQAYPAPPGPAGPTTTAPPPSAPSAPASNGTQINVDVSPNGNLVFSPNNITAAVGDTVTFYFPSTLDHSVTQSTFANPCTYLAADSNNTSAGFDSGLTNSSTFSIMITTTDPIWFHCRMLTHCASGMVGSINAPTTGNQTFAAFMSAAMNLGSSAPVETSGTVAILPSSGIGAVATAAPSNDLGTSPGSASGASKITASTIVGLLSAACVFFVFA